MKRFIILFVLFLAFVQCRKNGITPLKPDSRDCVPSSHISNNIVQTTPLTALMEKYVAKGFPGISFIARKGNQYWEQQKGFSDKEAGREVKSCMIWPGFSITQVYLATAVLKLKEEGRIDLERKISTCLPASVVLKIPGADKISIRMLLNHSSGIEDFWNNPEYVLGYMADPEGFYSFMDYLHAAQQRLFDPGTNIAYSATNNLILALVIEHITGKPHQEALKTYISQPLNLGKTFYKQVPAGELMNTPQLYADTVGEGNLVNYTDHSFIQFQNESGNNGILATPKNYVDFLHALTHSKILSGSTFREMTTWAKGNNTSETYGLGLQRFEYRGRELYGRSSSSFGGRSLLLYLPEKDLVVFAGINVNAAHGGPALVDFAHFVQELTALLTS